ncbi:MAG: methylmalonyl-CoA epimerase [Planctomycetes bacterium]|nr:methylmalonyl-CoA epimerase [Planctomycetota bacterium]
MEPTSRPQGLHHVGIAVRSLQEALPRWTDGLGLLLHSIDEVPTEKVRVAVLLAGETRIELLEPTSPDSPIAKFLDKRGPGVHHLAFAVDDCARALGELAAAGAPALDRAPRPGAHGCRVGFVHPRYLDGVLTELVEDPHHE